MLASYFGKNRNDSSGQDVLPTTQVGGSTTFGRPNITAPIPLQPQPSYSLSPYPPQGDAPQDDASDYEMARAKAGGIRTPSPSPSEIAAVAPPKGFKASVDGIRQKNWRNLFQRKYLGYMIIGLFVAVIFILFISFHNQIVQWLQPGVRFLHNLKAGWLIPIAIMIVLSFPPLFGHELVILLVGLVWGLGEGFGIVAAGTIIGELANFYAFKYCCSARGHKLEETNISYACLARIVREGGLKIALIARFSAMPGHLTTAVFSTCGMSVWTFLISAIAGLPKQLAFVYFGVALEVTLNNKHSPQNIIKNVILGLTFIITFVALHFLRKKMDAVKPDVIYERRKRRQAKMLAEAYQKGDLESGSPSPSQAAYPVPLHAASNPPPYV